MIVGGRALEGPLGSEDCQKQAGGTLKVRIIGKKKELSKKSRYFKDFHQPLGCVGEG